MVKTVAEAQNLPESTTQVHQGVPQPPTVNPTQERTISVENEGNLADLGVAQSAPTGSKGKTMDPNGSNQGTKGKTTDPNGSNRGTKGKTLVFLL